MNVLQQFIKVLGGPGSGNFGHAGRPGQVGGSAPSGEGSRGRTDKPVVFRPRDIWDTNNVAMSLARVQWKRRSVEAVAAKLDGKGKELKPLIKALSDIDLVAISPEKSNLEDPEAVKTVVNSFIASWANSACDSSPTALAIQKAAADEFGLPLPDRVLEKLKGPLRGSTWYTNARDTLLKDGPQAGFRLLLRAQYEATQDFLKEKGVESITLARGMAIKKEVARGMSVSGGKVEVESNPLSSWTLDKDVALTFSGMGDREVDAPRILVSTFDRQDIMAIPGTGMGCLPEAEFVVRGGRHVAQSYDDEHLKDATGIPPWIPPEEPKGNARGWGLPVIDIDAINEDWPKRTNDKIPRWPWPKRGGKGVPKVHGGSGSGNFGHSGRPGQVGGSAPASMKGFEPRGAIGRNSFEKGAEPVWTRNGKPISGDDLKRVEALKGTKVWGPGYVEAWVNGDPKAELLAVAKDGKGRYHRIYSREHIEKALLEKHDRVRAMAGDIKTMDRRAAADRREGVPEAYLYKLENLTTFRMGSNRDTKAKVQAYGLTTLEGRHITVDGDSLRFQFTAKGGKEVDRTLRDAELAGFVRARKEERGDGRLWPEITASRFNAYLDRLAPAGRNYKAKDFRDYHATRLALKVMREHASSGDSSERAWKRACNEAARQASEFLGNTPAMARQVYIDPLVFDVGRPMSTSEGT